MSRTGSASEARPAEDAWTLTINAPGRQAAPIIGITSTDGTLSGTSRNPSDNSAPLDDVAR
ncbi:hypothetical protein [Streptomyces glaucescens]|uniref:Uncharacterized protein n=1 Tax=Streptomyces glaucescens TaxID=1907 RepID=A0A089YR03_STRGA|nr:hypothetical protein [Streptomyces glaucescens]AIR96090.1 hypothetical protein SGLAU_00310 [Streptomyces glaucescens]